MSKIQTKLDERVQEICTHMGTFHIQRKQVAARLKQIDDMIESMDSELKAINGLTPRLVEAEEECSGPCSQREEKEVKGADNGTVKK